MAPSTDNNTPPGDVEGGRPTPHSGSGDTGPTAGPEEGNETRSGSIFARIICGVMMVASVVAVAVVSMSYSSTHAREVTLVHLQHAGDRPIAGPDTGTLVVVGSSGNTADTGGDPQQQQAVGQSTDTSASSGQTRGASRPNTRFAIVTYAAGDKYKEARLISKYNREHYCSIHACTYYGPDQRLDTSRPGHWDKILYLKKYMQETEHEWFLWIDADAVIAHHNVALDEYIDDDHDMVITGESTGGKPGVNTGVFLLRNCPWSLDLLDRIWKHAEFVNDPTMWYDQRATIAVLFSDKDAATIRKRVKVMEWGQLQALQGATPAQSARNLVRHVAGCYCCYPGAECGIKLAGFLPMEDLISDWLEEVFPGFWTQGRHRPLYDLVQTWVRSNGKSWTPKQPPPDLTSSTPVAVAS